MLFRSMLSRSESPAVQGGGDPALGDGHRLLLHDLGTGSKGNRTWVEKLGNVQGICLKHVETTECGHFL